MEVSNLRQKKRKTRKYLNELRKKSLRSGNSRAKMIEVDSKVKANHRRVLGANHGNNYITSNRLTLAILPKAVRSETITRPLLAEIQAGHERGKLYTNKVGMNKDSPETVTGDIEVGDLETNNLSNNSCIMFSDEDNEDELEKERFERNNLAGKLESPVRVASDAAACSAPPAPHTASVYEQFVDNISEFLQLDAPWMLREDVAEKPVAAIRKMYFQARERENDQEPLFTETCLQPASPSCLSPSRDIARMQDSPDYTYFPHRLNK